MRNIRLIAYVIIAALSTSVWAQKTYTFDDGVSLEADWTVYTDVPTGGTAECGITSSLSGASFTAKSGNFLGLAYKNKSNIAIEITSKTEYRNISSFSMDAVSGDNGKPTFAAYIVDASGAIVETLFAPVGTKDGFNTGGTNKWGSKTVSVNNKSGYIKIATIASSSGKFAAIDNISITYQAGPSTDATLSGLTYNGTAVPGFSAGTLEYSVELPAGTTAIPTVAATANDNAATITITQAPTLPGLAKVLVTAEDGTTTNEYKITFTVESSAPKVLSATWANIRGTASIDEVNKTITGQVLNGNSLTIEPQFTCKYPATWTPTGAQNFANGAITYTFTSATNETTTYSVAITEAPAMSTDATLKSLKYNGTSVPNFSPATYVYNIELASTASVPTITAEANDIKANAVITQAQGLPGVATVLVTAEDNTVTQTYTVNFTVAVPSTTLTLHEPEVYEAKSKEGGYGGHLVINGGYEYEVYYAGRLDDGGTKLTVHIDPIDKSKGVTKNETNTSYEAVDGWFKGTGSDKGTSFAALEEFNKATERCHTLSSSNTIEMHIQGYDQFSLYAADKKWNPSKPSDCKYFKVSIDDVEQTMTSSTSQTIRRFGITTGEHVIKITLVGDGNLFGGFSLRVPQQPKTKHIKGNDSTQVILQTMDIKKVLYSTKYNNLQGAETRLLWIGPEATGISLTKVNSSTQMIDTFQLSGHANCPVGTYSYKVVAYYNGVEANHVSGAFSVISDIKSLTAINAEGYQGEEIDQIRFRYYAISANDVTLTWPNGQPQGVSGNGNNGTYVISGTPTEVGTYPYEISVVGADTVIKGKLTVKELNYGQNPVLYLYKNDSAYTKDGTYHYLLGTTTGKWNFITRREKEDGLRSADQYSKYKWILISEDVDADNPEVLAIARGEVALPVLNMKSFTYTPGRLEWGEPDNGSLTDEGRYITVYRADHPIFKALNKHKGDKIMVLDTVVGKGLMPINVNYDNTLCLATALTRDIDDYFGDGPEQTIMHEVQRPNGKKYICFPMGIEGSKHLTTDGQKLIDQTIKYLLSDEATIQAPSLAITEFKVGKYTGDIDEANHLITIPVLDKDSDLMKAATPTITLASPLTFVTPNSGETVDFSNWHYGIRYVVSDYTSKKYYNVIVRLYNPQGIDNIEAGTWLNIFDVYGRKVATTNQDIRTMDLPHGMYIVVTESGQTIKIMR